MPSGLVDKFCFEIVSLFLLSSQGPKLDYSVFIFNPSLSNTLFLMTVQTHCFDWIACSTNQRCWEGSAASYCFFLFFFWYGGSEKEINCPETTGSFLENRNRSYTGTFKEKWRDGESTTELRSILLQFFYFLLIYCVKPLFLISVLFWLLLVRI